MKTFKFKCKQNQTNKVVSLLSKYGKPHIEISDGVPMVSVNLPENVSKRSVDKYLFNMGIPGANPRNNNNPVIKIKSYKDIVYRIPENVKQKVIINGVFKTVWWKWCSSDSVDLARIFDKYGIIE